MLEIMRTCVYRSSRNTTNMSFPISNKTKLSINIVCKKHQNSYKIIQYDIRFDCYIAFTMSVSSN